MQVPKPFGSQLHVSIARNGYLLFAPKPSLEREFGKKWYKDLLKIQYKVRLKKARKIDHRKLMKITGQIFTLPLESTEYLETIDRCSQFTIIKINLITTFTPRKLTLKRN